ncbi:MAG: hypothetical protein WAQ52_00360 [Terriglobales bacterium]
MVQVQGLFDHTGNARRPVPRGRYRLLRTLVSAFLFFAASSLASAQFDLTGTWTADDGGVYYLRQIGNELWWAGFSVETPAGAADLHKGLLFTNVFQGHLSGNSVIGDWADVPRGRILHSGTLTLGISGNQIQRQAATGGFGATVWNRTGPALPPTDIFSIFDRVKKNQNAWRDHSLLDNLKPAKGKPVAILGNIVPIPIPPQIVITNWFPLTYQVIPASSDPDPMHVNYRTRNGRSYNDFICLDDNDSPPDGDIDFNLQVDRTTLDAQILFWSDGWETNHGITSSNFRNKLDRQNELHVESIMYGGTTECGDDGTTSLMLPGWQQGGAAAAPLNGVPIAGQMDLTDRDANSSRVNSILGKPIEFGARVRVTGILTLDCGHGLLHNCDEDEADTQNQEIHPVYALDLVQNFHLPRPLALLTGVWSCDDAGTYYVRQIGDTVWWLGLSVDEGRTFANVFRGTLQNGQVSGDWADVPLGQTSNAGTLVMAGGAGQLSTVWTLTGVTGGFGGDSWEKLYDAGWNKLVVVFESAAASAAFWPNTTEPFELVVGGERVEARPTSPHPVKLPDGRRITQADLGARIPIDAPAVGPLRMKARFAGYRANWAISELDLKPGVYVQTLMTARALPMVAAQTKKGEVPISPPAPPALAFDRDTTAGGLPGLTIRYRIELADASGQDRPPRPSPRQ